MKDVSKWEFRTTSVSYLGYRLIPEGILQKSNKLRAVRDSTPPVSAINKIYDFVLSGASSRALEPLIKKSITSLLNQSAPFFKTGDNILKFFIHMPLVHPYNILQLFQLIPYQISFGSRTNYSMIPKLDKSYGKLFLYHHSH
jgi:hypothetical protein